MTEPPPCWHGDRLKRTYRSKSAANKARIKAGNRKQFPAFRIYKCSMCDGWHLTSKNVK